MRQTVWAQKPLYLCWALIWAHEKMLKICLPFWPLLCYALIWATLIGSDFFVCWLMNSSVDLLCEPGPIFVLKALSSPLFCARMSRITSIKNSAGIAIIIYSTDRSLSSFSFVHGLNKHSVWKSFWWNIGLHYDCSRAEFDRENFSQTFCTLSNVCAAWVMQQMLFGVTVSFPFDRF